MQIHNSNFKTLLLLFASIFVSQTVSSQETSVVFDVVYGSTGSDVPYNIIPDGNGGVYTHGSTNSYGASFVDNWLVHFDQNGNELFNKIYGSTFDDYGQAMIGDPSGDIWFGGSTRTLGPTSFSHDTWLVRADANGNIIFHNSYLATPSNVIQEIITGIILDGSGGVYISGYVDLHLSQYLRNAFVAHVDAAGNLLWSTVYGGANDEYAGELVRDPGTGNVYMAGNTKSFGAGGWDVFLLALNGSTGSILYSNTYGGTADDFAGSIERHSSGDLFIVGSTKSFGAGDTDGWLLRLDPTNGNLLASSTFGSTGADAFSDAVLDGDNIVLLGGTNSSGAGSFDFWLVRADVNGNEIWSETYGGPGSDFGTNLIGDLSSGFFLNGSTTSFGAVSNDGWLLKVTVVDDCSAVCGRHDDKLLMCHIPPGNPNKAREICIDPDDKDDHLDHGDVCGTCPSSKTGLEGSVEDELFLDQGMMIFPNPFSSRTTISFSVLEAGDVTLEVLDMTGRSIAMLYNSAVESMQRYNVEFDGSTVPSGIYITKLTDTNGKITHKRMIVQ
ncbi:MAG: T9SS type A sorting domain-containing protein [Bacteroidetes bacterium]|nr:T9SS type A sorting domain-containing protein [Bacteroidota bacterium]